MGLILVPESPVSPKQALAEDRLYGFRQDGLERYVEEFTELAYLANWPDAPLNACFLAGLDEGKIRFSEPACFFPLVEAINLILFLNGSDFVIEEVQEESCSPRPVPTEIQAAWSVRQSPVSSACSSSGHPPDVLPDPHPKPASERSTARPKRPKKKKKAAEQFQSPAFSASVQSQSPAFSTSEPEPSLLVTPPPVPVGLLIEYEGMDWTPFPDPAPAFAEPAPAFHEPTPGFHEPAPALAEPTPAKS
ncbi:hypothetical protein DPX16_10003 [Anabarilius grahami]|uniref:Uncharacterized protein n=1 Tax=Anabarilius grahami TaxID=495550 RepID=A0A3N0XWQ7_ANAGA|nr:hypothetical protein DPX16_10003 [Anabarilius grahami]